jgi:hypothetical protein
MLHVVRHTPLLWLPAFVPVVLVVAKLKPEAHTLLFVLAVLAIVPLAAMLSQATESVAAKTGDAVGGLLNATLANLTCGTLGRGSRIVPRPEQEVRPLGEVKRLQAPHAPPTVPVERRRLPAWIARPCRWCWTGLRRAGQFFLIAWRFGADPLFSTGARGRVTKQAASR